MIKFKSDTELAIVTDYDEKTDTLTGETTEVFKAGGLYDAEIVDKVETKGDMFVNLQFPDGSLALGVQRDCFEVVE